LIVAACAAPPMTDSIAAPHANIMREDFDCISWSPYHPIRTGVDLCIG